MQRIDDAARGPSFVFRREAQNQTRRSAPAATGATR
jgi:hypothetical protein